MNHTCLMYMGILSVGSIVACQTKLDPSQYARSTPAPLADLCRETLGNWHRRLMACFCPKNQVFTTSDGCLNLASLRAAHRVNIDTPTFDARSNSYRTKIRINHWSVAVNVDSEAYHMALGSDKEAEGLSYFLKGIALPTGNADLKKIPPPQQNLSGLSPNHLSGLGPARVMDDFRTQIFYRLLPTDRPSNLTAWPIRDKMGPAHGINVATIVCLAAKLGLRRIASGKPAMAAQADFFGSGSYTSLEIIPLPWIEWCCKPISPHRSYA